MTEQKIMCDRCGSIVLTDRTIVAMTTGPLRNTAPSSDLCHECASLFLSWLRSARQCEASTAAVGTFP